MTHVKEASQSRHRLGRGSRDRAEASRDARGAGPQERSLHFLSCGGGRVRGSPVSRGDAWQRSELGAQRSCRRRQKHSYVTVVARASGSRRLMPQCALRSCSATCRSRPERGLISPSTAARHCGSSSRSPTSFRCFVSAPRMIQREQRSRREGLRLVRAMGLPSLAGFRLVPSLADGRRSSPVAAGTRRLISRPGRGDA